MKDFSCALLCSLLAAGGAHGFAAARRPLTQVSPSKPFFNVARSTPLFSATAAATPTLKERLSSAGRGGLLAYGFLNFLYYTSVTAIAWHFSSAGRAETAAAALAATTLQQRVSVSALRMGKVAGIVWIGSQITKPQRLTGALVLSPLGDKVLRQVQSKTNLSVGKAFALLCALLLSSTALFYGAIILLSSLM